MISSEGKTNRVLSKSLFVVMLEIISATCEGVIETFPHAVRIATVISLSDFLFLPLIGPISGASNGDLRVSTHFEEAEIPKVSRKDFVVMELF